MQQPIDTVIRATTDDIAATLRDFIFRRLSFALRRFEHRVRRVKVRQAPSAYKRVAGTEPATRSASIV